MEFLVRDEMTDYTTRLDTSCWLDVLHFYFALAGVEIIYAEERRFDCSDVDCFL